MIQRDLYYRVKEGTGGLISGSLNCKVAGMLMHAHGVFSGDVWTD